jgi:hypothetical protein
MPLYQISDFPHLTSISHGHFVAPFSLHTFHLFKNSHPHRKGLGLYNSRSATKDDSITLLEIGTVLLRQP